MLQNTQYHIMWQPTSIELRNLWRQDNFTYQKRKGEKIQRYKREKIQRWSSTLASTHWKDNDKTSIIPL